MKLKAAGIVLPPQPTEDTPAPGTVVDYRSDENDFAMLGREFYRCYFGNAPCVTVTEVAKVLGVGKIRAWSTRFRDYMLGGRLPYVMKKGRPCAIPETLAAWFQLESNKRGNCSGELLQRKWP